MKIALHLHALIFCLFLFGLTSTTTLAKFLRDLEGEPIYNGGSYYIVPVFRGKGGGLELAPTGSEKCPLTVVQARSETSRGLPATLSTPYLIQDLSTEFLLNIEFTAPYSCAPSPSRWKVDEESKTVKITKETQLVGPFRIRTHGDDYKLEYCDLESQGDLDCKDLGISVDDEYNRRLVVKDGDPLLVQFVRADDKDSARKSIV